ncbi:acetyl-CoA synthetase [Pikeienuella piscinae]|uniref:Acetyl-CoA synthetase n=1 Tax=Pikeienuella piscinae TaxID=2748098 RepID=A0A7L5BWA3_9RHOB|nr:acetate--CoA ligase family protein [Pikeienuella piscinae]QIE56002.1 acetyl-CoA synthetase [Pikeienuella piscinae]
MNDPHASAWRCVRTEIIALRDGGGSALDEHHAKTVLDSLGIAVPRGVRVNGREEIAPRLRDLSAPFALKALAVAPLHKSDIGAVRLHLPSAASIELARTEIASRLADSEINVTGYLVEEMAEPGVELVIGGIIDPQLGPMLMLGAGGIFAEILDDSAFGLCPISRIDAQRMMRDLKVYPILAGARGREPVAMDAIVDALIVLGGPDGFFTHNADLIREFDLNPIFAAPDGIVAVDARVVIGGAR